MSKKKEAIREIHHSDGRIEEQYLDGTSQFIDPKNPQGLPQIRDIEQLIADLQKDPKSRLLRDAAHIYLLKLKEAEGDKTTFKEWYDKIAELTGAQTPTSTASAVVQIIVGTPGQPPEKRVIDITAKEKKEED